MFGVTTSSSVGFALSQLTGRRISCSTICSRPSIGWSGCRSGRLSGRQDQWTIADASRRIQIRRTISLIWTIVRTGRNGTIRSCPPAVTLAFGSWSSIRNTTSMMIASILNLAEMRIISFEIWLEERIGEGLLGQMGREQSDPFHEG